MAQHEDDESRDPVLGAHDPGRLLAVTDGVFAIIMTLLALELHVPSAKHGDDLGMVLITDGLPTVFAYVIGFLLAGVYWVGHRYLFSRVKLVDFNIVWQNVIFLMLAALIPFAAALIGRHPEEPLALEIYGVLLTLLAGWRLVMYRYITGRPDLLLQPEPTELRSHITRIMIRSVIAFAVCVAFGAFLPPILVLTIYGTTPLLFVLALRRARKVGLARSMSANG